MSPSDSRTLTLSAQKRELLKRLRQQKGLGVDVPDRIPLRDSADLPPLSYSQEWMWLLEQFASPAYNNPLTLALDGDLNVPVVEQSLTALLRRHEALRTLFVRDASGKVVQKVMPPSEWSLRLEALPSDVLPSGVLSSDVSCAGIEGGSADGLLGETAELDEGLASILIAETLRPFDLSQEFPLRVVLFRVSETCHYLHLTLHHIVSDDASYAILLRELSALYDSFSQDLPSPLAALPLQYGDYACWQRSQLGPDELERQLSYWRERFKSFSPGGLSLSGRYQPSQRMQGKKHVLHFSASLTAELKQLSQRCEVTLFTTLLAALNTLLYRYTGERDLLVGVPVSGRTRPELSELIGVFINNLLVRVDVSGGLSFGELLDRLNAEVLASRRYQDFPYVSLVQSLSSDRDLGGDGLLQVLFDYQGTPLPAVELPALKTRVFELDTGFSKVDLTLHLAEVAGELRGYFEYRADVFEADAIARLAAHFEILLQGIVSQPEIPLSQLPLLSAAEQVEQLQHWTATEADYPADRCIHELFEAQVERCPDAIALTFGAEQLTYGDLNERAEQLAAHLRSLGVGPEQLVGLCLERSLNMVVGLLGILKAGGAYVPLDPAYPRERVVGMLADSGASVVVSELSVASMLSAEPLDMQVVCIDSDWPKIASALPQGEHSSHAAAVNDSANGPANGPAKVSPENLAYVIFTSGSTGKPKGVQISHGAAVNFLSAMAQQPGLTANDTLLAVTTISFDIAVLELYLPLMVGATVALASREESMDGPQLRSRLQSSGATVMQATPASWSLLLASGWEATDAPNLKILCGGEALLPNLAAELLARGSSVWNMYGPTEATVWATCHQVLAADLGNSAGESAGESSGELSGEVAVSLGRPLPNLQTYILDSERQLVPRGVAGELYIGGVGLARGYLNRPELTAERFVANPFDKTSHETHGGTVSRLYRTGDLARYRSDGAIEYLGRLDHQVKLRGFRIELGEIEATLGQHPDIGQCVVTAREDQPGDQKLVAYWVPAAQNVTLAVSDLRQFLKQTLPDYMVPNAFVRLDALPLTPNGKVNRRELPVPDPSDIASAAAYVAPRTSLEEAFVEIWQQVLNLEKVGVDDNFFDIGGHSLLAVQLFTAMEKVSGRKLPLTTLFQAPTIADLAALLEPTAPEHLDSSALIPLQPKGHKPPLFLVPPGGATVVNLGRLVRHLKADRPVYGLEPLGMDGQQFPHTQVEAMAAYYIQEIQKLQPQGPYFLAGRCFGGIVTFEMAQQLWQQGHKVALLALLDTTRLPNYSLDNSSGNSAGNSAGNSSGNSAGSANRQLPDVKKDVRYYVSRFLSGHYVRLFLQRWRRGLYTPAGVFRSRMIRFCLKVLRKLEKREHPLWLFLQRELFKRFPTLFTRAAHNKARQDYWASVYPGPLTLFENSDTTENMTAKMRSRWTELTSVELNRQTIPGDHYTMLTNPNYAKAAADKLTDCLEDAQAKYPSS